MRTLALGLLTLSLAAGPAAPGRAQAPKTAPTPVRPADKEKAKEKEKAEEKAMAPGGFRTLNGTIGEVSGGGKSLKVTLPEAGAKGARAAQTWDLSLGKQTLVLRAGKNGQYSTIEMGDLAKGETIQAVAELAADGEGAHRTWWLITLPAGTTPPAR